MATANKVKFGLKKCYYAPITADDGEGTVTFGTPVALPGAVSITMSAEGDRNRFYADDGVYFTCFDNNGYSGSLELALIPDSFREDILGEYQDAKNVLVEKSGVSATPFALLFEFTGDAHQVRHVIYNVVASRPDVASQTKGETTEVQTETINLDAGPILLGTEYVVKAKTTEDVDSTVYSSWYTTVHQPAASA